MSTPFSYDVFISHNRSDKPWVRKFVEFLRAHHLRVFFDEDSIDYGADIVTSIDAAIECSAHVLLLLSPNSLTSKWVALETSISIYSDPDAQATKIIPILIEPVGNERITPSIRRLNRVDLTDVVTRERSLRKLLKQLGIAYNEIPLPAWPALSKQDVTQAWANIYSFCEPAREWYVSRIEEDIVRQILLTNRETDHHNIVVTGKTGFGKSSFLGWLAREARQAGYVLIDLRPTSDRLGDFYTALIHHGMNQIEELDLGQPKLIGVPSLDIDAVLSRITDKTNKRLLITIDQVENLLPLTGSVMTGRVWRNLTDTLTSQLHNPRIVWAFAVKESYFLALFPAEFSLGLIDSTYISLTELDHERATLLVKRLASLTKVTIGDQATDLIVAKAGGRPLTLVLAFLVALERSPTERTLEYDYLAETEPWNEIFAADYTRLDSSRQRLIVLALAHTGREFASQEEIISKVSLADSCPKSEVENDLKRIENEIGIIRVNEGLVSFVHSSFGLYVESKHHNEYPSAWSKFRDPNSKRSSDFMLTASVVQNIMATLMHNVMTRLGAGSAIAERLNIAVKDKDLNQVTEVSTSLSEWLHNVFEVFDRVRSLNAPYNTADDFTELASAIQNAARGPAQEKIAIELSGLSAIKSVKVAGQPEMIEAVFAELFQNAVDAAARHIWVTATTDKESKIVICHIKDDGVGISVEQRDRVFDDFFSSRKGKGPSTGLGLTFVRRVIEASGGSISLGPIEETGTSFIIRFESRTDS